MISKSRRYQHSLKMKCISQCIYCLTAKKKIQVHGSILSDEKKMAKVTGWLRAARGVL